MVELVRVIKMPKPVQSSNEEREFEAYFEALLRSYKENQEVIDGLAELDVPPPYRVRVKVVYAEGSPGGVVDRLVDCGHLSRLTNHSASYVYEASVGHKHEKQVRVPFFWPSSRTRSWVGM